MCAVRVSQEFREARSVLRYPFDGRLISPGFSLNYSHFDDPSIGRAMDRADAVADPAARGRAWAAIDRELTRRAVALPALWIKAVTVASSDVDLAIDPDAGTVDLAATRLR
jgi:peptide/nickel transport system substrate-binding protein